MLNLQSYGPCLKKYGLWSADGLVEGRVNFMHTGDLTPCCFTSSVLLFLEPLMTPLINWGHVLFQTMNKHNPQNSLHLSLPMNTALQEENSFPETHSHHSELLPYKQMDFQGGSGLAESLNLCSARQRTKGEIFKDKADKIKLLEYLWV